MFLLSPHQAQVSDEFEVQPDVLELAHTGFEHRVEGASMSSFRHHHTIALGIQVTLEGEQMGKYTKIN